MSTLGGWLARWSRTRRGAATLFALLFAVGVVLVILGGTVGGLSDYSRSALAAIGIALVVIAPVAVGERLLRIAVANANAKVDLARREVAQAQQTAEEAQRLASSLQAQLNRPRLEVADLEEKASEGDFQALASLYDQARRHHWIYDDGIRVETAFPGCGWVKVSVEQEGADKVIRLSFEEKPFKPIGVSADWMPGETAAGFLGRVAGLLQNANRAPDDETFKEPGLLALSAHALRMAIELHIGPDGDQGLDGIVLFTGKDWAVTDGSLVNLTPPLLPIRAQDFEAIRQEFAQKATSEFLSALGVAEMVQRELRWDHWRIFNQKFAS